MTDFSRRTLLATGAATAVAGVALPSAAQGSGAPRPYGATPSQRQFAWHKRGQYAFIHFTINTFTGREWGYGDESPKQFAPTEFSAEQIVAAAKAGGMEGIVLTAKHHDGFCLWPTMLTEHCIRNSPYKNGKGDIVREFEQATRRAGMAFAIYLSPWDRNHPEYGRPAYIDYFRKQIVELCTQYGELFEFWFDGANGGDGYYGGARETRKIAGESYYEWPETMALVHKHQPMAVIFNPPGSDIRWVGNEQGVAGDPCWPTMSGKPFTDQEGNSGTRNGPLWWPAETNTSIRPGWFYHENEDGQVKSPERLIQLFDSSIGRGTTFILNLPPDKRGLLHENDVATLKSYGEAQRQTYARDLAQGSVAHASHERSSAYAAARVLDGNPETYWSTPDGVTTPTLTLDLPPGRTFDVIRICEYLPLGVRVTKFAIDLEENGNWRTVAEHECIGAHRHVRLPQPSSARRLRLRIVDAPACPAITEISLYRQVKPVPVKLTGMSAPSPLARNGWTIMAASSPGAEALIDGKADTLWTTPAPTRDAPASVRIDLHREVTLTGFSLTPPDRSAGDAAPPHGYVVETSLDGFSWSPAAEGEFSNIANARLEQRIDFVPRITRYLRLTFAATALPAAKMAIADIGALVLTPTGK